MEIQAGRIDRLLQFPRVAAFLAARMRKPQSPPDFTIYAGSQPYLRRWWLLPRNRFFSVYLHEFLRDDEDRALHDHMYFSASFMLYCSYYEHTIRAGGVHCRELIRAGALRFRSPWSAHRIELAGGTCWTLFITGPRLRNWGFHCAERGWVPWQRFVSERDHGTVGRGCE